MSKSFKKSLWISNRRPIFVKRATTEHRRVTFSSSSLFHFLLTFVFYLMFLTSYKLLSILWTIKNRFHQPFSHALMHFIIINLIFKLFLHAFYQYIPWRLSLIPCGVTRCCSITVELRWCPTYPSHFIVILEIQTEFFSGVDVFM